MCGGRGRQMEMARLKEIGLLKWDRGRWIFIANVSDRRGCGRCRRRE